MKIRTILITLILFTTVFNIIPAENTNKTIYVDDNNTQGPWDGSKVYPYYKIQDGIDAANNVDTIFVYNGIYFENVVIDKHVKLIGEDKSNTIIDANLNGSVITVQSYNVIIRNFTLINSGSEFWDSGVEIRGVDCTIDNNIIKHNRQGIYLKNDGAYISNNHISENRKNYGAGIDCNGDDIIICNNIIYNNFGTGCEFYGSNNLLFTCNLVKQNKKSGVRMTNSKGGVFTGNIFSDNDNNGLEFTCGWNECDTINGNAFISNDNFGLYFCENGCDDISENNFVDNTKNTIFSYRDRYEQELFPCIWRNNYWDDLINIGPKILWGFLNLDTMYLRIRIPLPNIDMQPARRPFDIDIKKQNLLTNFKLYT